MECQNRENPRDASDLYSRSLPYFYPGEDRSMNEYIERKFAESLFERLDKVKNGSDSSNTLAFNDQQKRQPLQPLDLMLAEKDPIFDVSNCPKFALPENLFRGCHFSENEALLSSVVVVGEHAFDLSELGIASNESLCLLEDDHFEQEFFECDENPFLVCQQDRATASKILASAPKPYPDGFDTSSSKFEISPPNIKCWLPYKQNRHEQRELTPRRRSSASLHSPSFGGTAVRISPIRSHSSPAPNASNTTTSNTANDTNANSTTYNTSNNNNNNNSNSNSIFKVELVPTGDGRDDDCVNSAYRCDHSHSRSLGSWIRKTFKKGPRSLSTSTIIHYKRPPFWRRLFSRAASKEHRSHLSTSFCSEPHAHSRASATDRKSRRETSVIVSDGAAGPSTNGRRATTTTPASSNTAAPIYFVCFMPSEPIPFRSLINCPASQFTLRAAKNIAPLTSGDNFRYFFKRAISVSQQEQVVFDEITDDNSTCPLFGREVVCRVIASYATAS